MVEYAAKRSPNRWSSCAHRTQSGNEIVGQTRCFIGHDPSIDREPAYGIITARQRQHTRSVGNFQPVHIVTGEFGAGL
jgi:hypothetical protein